MSRLSALTAFTAWSDAAPMATAETSHRCPGPYEPMVLYASFERA